jgi:hypothetical protein
MYINYNRCHNHSNSIPCGILKETLSNKVCNNNSNLNNTYEYLNSQSINNCECGYETPCNGLPENPIYAQAYVRNQTFNKVFTPEEGLRMGTLFPELARPYIPNQSFYDNNFIRKMSVIKGGCNNGYMQ